MIPAGLEGIGRLESVELFVVPARLSLSVGTALHEHTDRRVGFVRVRGSEAEGFGEIAAMDQVVGLDPSLDAVLEALAEIWIPRLFEAARSRGGDCPPSHALAVLGGSADVDRMAAAALEMAVLDGELRRSGQSLCGWLGVEVPSVPYGVLCGIPSDRSIETLVDRAAGALADGAGRVRVKVEPSWLIEPLRSLRRELPDARLQADANGSLGGEAGLVLLRQIDDLSLACIEEPIGGRDLTASAALSSELRTPVCLDETLRSPRTVRDALRYGACGVLCVKPGRLGGIRAALRVILEAHDVGVACFIGGMFEAGLGRSSLGALAGRPEVSMIGDVAGASSYLVEDPCNQAGPAGGRQALYGGPGVGPWPDSGLLVARWGGGRSAL
jgi:O-succinylbenzoate synthase